MVPNGYVVIELHEKRLYEAYFDPSGQRLAEFDF
jgi:hypothetical protein